MRGLAAAVLVFEAIIVGLAIPVAITVAEVDATRAVLIGGGLAIGCLVTAGLLRRRIGIPLGWALQVLVVLSGFVVPAMFIVGGLFAVLWVVALRLGTGSPAAPAG